MFLRGIIIMILLFHNCSSQKVKIGIVNDIWKAILEQRLVDREWNNKCLLYEVKVPSNISFYQAILQVHDFMVRMNIDVIIGDSRLDVAQTAAALSIPFIAFDSRVHIKTRLEYSNMPHFYSLPVSEDKYALALFDILGYYKIINVAIIVDHTVDYQNFVQQFFEKKSLFSKVWTIPSNPKMDQSQFEIEIERILKEIRKNNYHDIIVKANKQNVNSVFLKARFYGMISKPTRWYLPNFVCENFNIENLKHIFTNFTFINEDCSERLIREKSKSEKVSLVNQFLQIIRILDWDFKTTTVTKLLKHNSKSLLSFDENGYRNQYSFLFHTLARKSDKLLSLIGSWQKSINKPRIFHLKIDEKDIEFKESEFPSYLRIVAVEEHPHLIVRNNVNVGFGVDLIHKIASILNFNFTIKVVTSYGTRINGTWDGLMGELIYGKSDMSLGPVVQTEEREEVLDFSTTFKQREISLVMKKPTSSTSYFQFLGPFSGYIWLCVVSSIILLIIILIIIEYFHDKYFPEEDRIKFNLKESSWFIVASTLQGGTEDVPFSVPGRILTGTLYFFVMIIVTSYTANLAAFLTVKAYPNPIKSIDDLANLPPDSKISFGTVAKSAIHEFFQHSEIPSYQKIYRLMTIINKEWLVNSSSEGYRRAMTENYVFIWDDSVNQYEIFVEPEYKCRLYLVGRPFGKRSFAISMSQGSCYKEKLNSAILNLLETGVIENLEHKWWKGSSICPSDEASSEISSGSLSVEELAGVFLVLLCGSVIAIISLIIKIILRKWKPKDGIRGCCTQFFAHLPITAEPPIQPKSPRTTIEFSRQSTLASSLRNDNKPSPSHFALQTFFPSNDVLDDDDELKDVELI